MPQIIEVPGQGRIEFPDGMSDADISSAIKKLAPPAAPKYSPADEAGVLGATMIAAGKSADRAVRGIQQLYYGAKSKFETPTQTDLVAHGGKSESQRKLDQLKSDTEYEDSLYEPLAQKHPIATGVGEALPALAIPVGGPAAGAAKFIAKSTLAGAIPGLISYGSAEERLKRGAVGAAGGAIGGGAGVVLNKVLKPGGLTPGISQEAIGAAKRLDLPLTAGQITQNPAMVNFENYLARSPGSSGALQSRAAAQSAALNRAGASAMGQPGSDLGELAFAKAKDAIGKEFQRLENVTAPQLGNDFLQTLAGIDASNAAKGAFKSKSVDALIDKSLDLAQQGKLTGTAYKEIRTQLGNEAQSAFKSGDAALGQAYKAVRNALDDAARGSLSEADQKAWDVARSQWQAYKLLSRSNVAEAGNLSAPRLAATMRQQLGDTVRTGSGRGPLADVARIGEAIKGSANPNSGQLALSSMYSSPLFGLPMMGLNKLSERAYMNKLSQAYLSNGLLSDALVGPGQDVLTARAAGLLGPVATQQYLGTR